MKKKAIVIGGSMAGLTAARALADHFDKVIVIDRDELPAGPDYRKGVPQARHLHLLLLRGKQILESYFPGITKTLIEDGVPVLDAGSEFLSISSFGPVARSVSGIELLLCSRVLLEWRVRERLQAYENIEFLTRTEVTGFVFDGEGRKIEGVRTRSRAGSDSRPEIRADLVVDVSGRESKSPKWFASHGFSVPPVTEVNSHLGYATRWYRRKTKEIDGWKAILMNVRVPHIPRAGALFPTENDYWVCTLAGVAGAYPPTDEAGFLEFAENLADPIIFNAIRDAEPVTPILGYRKTQNVWHHYEKLDRMPAGFIAMGDAVCAFNPVYGQGMTAGALGAMLLSEHLSQGSDLNEAFGKTYQKRLAKILETPWAMATGEDFRWPETEGPSPGLAGKIGHWYSDRVLKVAVHDAAIGRAFLEVVHLLKPRESLLQPRILFKALWG